MNQNILSSEQLKKFSDDGFVVIPDFLTNKEVSSLKESCRRLVDEMNPLEHVTTTFCSADKTQGRNSYFLESGDKVSFFFEPDALGENGKLKVDRHLAFNKIGHSLHRWVPEFKAISFSPKVKAIARQLSFRSPAIVHSMYIFKQPKYGEEVVPHKDCTFLSTNPQSCVGLWFALEDAHEGNGCLWFSPGSHKTPTKRRFIRNPDKNGPLTMFTNPPDPDDPTKYIPVPARKGTLVLIDGQVDHKSSRNTSASSRHIYTFHVIERDAVCWDEKNWLQPTKLPFMGLFEN